MQRLRADRDLVKPPGVAETLDWARALHALGTRELDIETAAAHPRGGGEVPRGRRAGPGGPRRGCWPDDRRRCSPSPRSCCSASPARCAPPGVAVTAGPRRAPSSRRSPRVGLDDQPASTAPGGPRCAPPRTTSTRYDQVFAAWFSGQRAGTKDRPPAAVPRGRRPALGATESRRGAGRRRPGRRPRAGELRPRCCGTATSPTLDPARARGLAALFGSAAPRAPRADAPTGTRRPRRGAVDARATLRSHAAPDGGAGRGRAGGAGARRPRRSCCSSTSPGR